MPRAPLSPRSVARERRKRGTRIKSGFDELGDLDAAPARRERHEAPAVPAVSAASPAGLSAPAAPATAPATAPAERPAVPAAPAPSGGDWRAAESVFGRRFDEWRSVKQMLFPPPGHAGAAGSRRAALEHMQLLWRARARQRRPVPPYAEATAVLLEAVVLDESGQLSSSGSVVFYGAAISRVVHIMTGTFAVGNADTYRKRAKMIGFPEEAVEVRQRVAHGALPLLSELRWVCGLVLQFLFHCYWLEQERHARLIEEEEGENSEGQEKENNKLGAPTAESNDSANGQHATLEEMQKLLSELSDLSDSERDEEGTNDTDEKDNTCPKQQNENEKEEEIVNSMKETLSGGWILTE